MANLFEIFKANNVVVYKVSKQGLDKSAAVAKAFSDFMQFNNLYFSFNYDLCTNLYNNLTKKENLPEYQKLKHRFVFNGNYFQHPKYSTAFVHGFVDTGFAKVKERPVNTYIISKKDCRRLGSRLWCRGADEQGHCANYVETEHITEITENIDSFKIQSYIITRGSPAIHWSQQVDLKFNPPIKILEEAKNENSCNKHLNEHTKLYGNTMVVNLIEKTKHYQFGVGREWNSRVEAFSHMNNEVKSMWFDFHKECSSKNGGYKSLYKLLAQSQEFLDAQGSYVLYLRKNEVVEKRVQTGVVRVNCFDSLDRTNVVQTNYSKYMAYKFLVESFPGQEDKYAAGIKEIVPLPAELDKNFRYMWTDNADALSRSYTGTGSLKTDYTRTGKRNWYGPLQDGYNSYLRYFMNSIYGSSRDNVYNEIYDGLDNLKTTENWNAAVLKAAVLVPVATLTLLVGVTVWHVSTHNLTVLHWAYFEYLKGQKAAGSQLQGFTAKLNSNTQLMRHKLVKTLGISDTRVFDSVRIIEIILLIFMVIAIIFVLMNKLCKKRFVGVRNKGD